MKATLSCLCAALALAAATANAQFNLQITEIWPGNEPGSNLHEDWFEVTNKGDVAWTTADGELYFDDVSMDVVDAVPLTGVTSIAPGESVIFYNDPASSAEFESVWANVILPQIGLYDGSGLGQGGDGVTLFLSMGAPAGIGDIIDFEQYPDANATGGQSYNVDLAAFSTVGDAAGSLESALANDASQYAVASVGPAVPEPTAVLLSALAACGVLAPRRR